MECLWYELERLLTIKSIRNIKQLADNVRVISACCKC